MCIHEHTNVFTPRTRRAAGVRYRTETILCMPVKDHVGEMIAVLEAINKRTGTFGQQDEVRPIGYGLRGSVPACVRACVCMCVHVCVCACVCVCVCVTAASCGRSTNSSLAGARAVYSARAAHAIAPVPAPLRSS